MTMTSNKIGIALDWDAAYQVADNAGLDLHQAHSLGEEDALGGVDQRGSDYFPLCGVMWDSYNVGYMEGVLQLKQLRGEATDEGDIMEHAFQMFTSGAWSSRCPDVDWEAVEAEAVGYAESRYPWEF